MGFIAYDIDFDRMGSKTIPVDQAGRICGPETYTTEHSLEVVNSFGKCYTPVKRYEDFCTFSSKLREQFWWMQKNDIPELPTSTTWLLYYPFRSISSGWGQNTAISGEEQPTTKAGGEKTDDEQSNGQKKESAEASTAGQGWSLFLSQAERQAAFERRRKEDVAEFMRAVLGVTCFAQSAAMRAFLTEEEEEEEEGEEEREGEGKRLTAGSKALV